MCESKVGDASSAIGGSVDGRIMNYNNLAVPGKTGVEFNHVCTGADSLLEGCEGIFGMGLQGASVRAKASRGHNHFGDIGVEV